MKKEVESEGEKGYLSHPKIKENYPFLQEIGVIDYFERLNQEINNIKSLLSKGLDIFNRTSIDEIMNTTVFQISDYFLPSFIAFLWKPIQNREDITIRAYKNYKPVDINLRVDSITPFETFFQQYPQPVNFELLAYELHNDEAIKPFLEAAPEIAVPILGPLGLYGIILVGKKLLDDKYTNEELYFLKLLMSFVSQAIKNHLHYENSLRDVKTGLYNHGFFLNRLNEEIARIRRNGYTSSVIVIGVDSFKKFNDSYGHLAGDKVLEKLAQEIKAGVRTEDIPSSFGGEEFTVLLPHTDTATALTVAERLRINVANMQVTWEVSLPQVTISSGIYTFDESTNTDVNGIMRRADEALYISKELGRNRCTVWKPSVL
jgi:diguanylate cyclase (GGDEF)-like protein